VVEAVELDRGWNTDFGKRKYGVHMDRSDLLDLLAERGAADPEKTAAAMTTWDRHEALDHWAQMLMYRTLGVQEPQNADGEDGHIAMFRKYQASRNALADKYIRPAAG
jgi:hypothetical protein